MLTVNMTIKSSPVKAVMQLATSYPYPEPGKYGLPEISVVSCDNVAYDYENALISFSNAMTRHWWIFDQSSRSVGERMSQHLRHGAKIYATVRVCAKIRNCHPFVSVMTGLLRR